MQAIIIAIGDELILGQSVDTNSAWLSARLAELGVLVRAHLTVPDDQAEIVRAVRQAVELAELVVITGGLGPTADDLTRQALAEVIGVPLVLQAAALARIEQFFKDRGRAMSESNRQQALVPEGGALLDNSEGTAPGLKLAIGRAQVFVFPGVPGEMKPMFERNLAPIIGEQAARTILTRKLNTFGHGEAVVGETLSQLMRRDRNPLLGTTVSAGIVSVRIRSDFPTREQAQAELELAAQLVKQKLGTAVFSEGDVSLAAVVGQLLREKRRTVATAESCTAGLLSAMLTEAPGSSAWFLGGFVVYANRLKTSLLGVPEEFIAREGAVSKGVVRRMAEETLTRSAADYALALTGVAGPAGGSPTKPVGTVWIALAKQMSRARVVTEVAADVPAAAGGEKQSSCACVVIAEKFLFAGERSLIRERAAKTALNLLRLELRKPDA